MHGERSELCCLGEKDGRYGSEAEGWRCGGHGPWSSEPSVGLASHASSPNPGLPPLEESSLSLAPIHLGEPRHSHHCLSLQERIVKVMDDYQIMDEFHYNLSTDDFNDK